MPKKSSKLSELLYEIDKDQLCDILLNIAESSPEVDSRIRTLLTPKSQLNNPISYYKKLISKLPTRIRNISDRKLLLEGLKPVLTQIKDLQNTKNYLEANKPLFVILEIVLFKLAKSDVKSMVGEMQKAAIAWCENLDKINNSELQFHSLQEVLNLERSKELNLEPRLAGFMIRGGEPVPNYYSNALHTDFYQLLLQLSKSINSVSVLEDLSGFLTKHKQSKAFSSQLLNISQKLDSESDFIKKVSSNLQTRESALLLKDFYWNKGEFVKAVDALYQHIVLNKQYFQYKSSDEYTSALDYIELFENTPEYCKIEDCCQVLIYLITTGEYNTAQDISEKAKWKPFLKKLVEIGVKNFDVYYLRITDILTKKYLYKILAEVALLKRDKNLLSKYLNYIEDWDGVIEACQLIAEDYSDIALKKIANISRSQLSEYNYYSYYQEDFRVVISKDRFLKVLETIKANISPESHKQIDNMIKKVNLCYNALRG
jgi:hypothetical protein